MIPDNYLFRWMLHKIDPSPDPPYSYYTLPEAAFRDIAQRIELQHPGKIIYTFDDGHSSDLEISLSILEEVGAVSRGCFFITTSWIGKEGYMTKDQVYSLANRPVSIGTHGHTHGFFDKMTDKELAEELSVSRQIVEGITGRQVDALSVPGGKFDDRLKKLAAATGYKRIFTSHPWDKKNDGVCFLGRYCIHRKNMNRMQKIYSHPAFYRNFLKAEHLGKQCLRSCLGERIYYSISSMIGKK
jgi:peptidoglycan/xylan/chitin deacetylase (PgdA/CDA1 family)